MAASATAGIGLNSLAPHRTIVRWGLLLASAGFAFTAIAVWLGRPVILDLLLSTLVLIVFAIQYLREHPNPLHALLGSALVLVVMGRWAFSSDTVAAGLAGLTVLLVASALVVAPFDWRFLTFGLAVIPIVFWWWPRFGVDPIIAGSGMAMAFILGSMIVFYSVGTVGAAAQRYADLFRQAPVGLIEEDWTEAIAILGQRINPGEDVVDRLTADPELLTEVITAARVVAANELAAKIFERLPEEMLGPVQITSYGPLAESTWPGEVAAIYRGEAYSARHKQRTSDGGIRYLDGSTVPIGRRVMLSMTDVTAAESAREDLEQSARSKDRFIAAVSHELRTPLAAILGFSQILISERDVSDDERREMLEFITEESAQVAWVIEDLLVTARTEGGVLTVKSSAVDLRTIVVDVAREVAGIEIEGGISGWSAIADPGRLRHLVRNMFMNAVEHGGEARRAVLGRTGESLWLEVRDSGQPLSDFDHERIFSPYETAHDRPGLTASVGLGLAVARRLARLMDGDLVYFHDGEAVFKLTIPAVKSGRDELRAPLNRDSVFQTAPRD